MLRTCTPELLRQIYYLLTGLAAFLQAPGHRASVLLRQLPRAALGLHTYTPPLSRWHGVPCWLSRGAAPGGTDRHTAPRPSGPSHVQGLRLNGSILCTAGASYHEKSRPSASQISRGWGWRPYTWATACSPIQNWTRATWAKKANTTADVGMVVMKWTRPLCGSAVISQNDFKTSETIPLNLSHFVVALLRAQEAGPWAHKQGVHGREAASHAS
jgi:hypothetical protein